VAVPLAGASGAARGTPGHTRGDTRGHTRGHTRGRFPAPAAPGGGAPQGGHLQLFGTPTFAMPRNLSMAQQRQPQGHGQAQGEGQGQGQGQAQGEAQGEAHAGGVGVQRKERAPQGEGTRGLWPPMPYSGPCSKASWRRQRSNVQGVTW